jgi:tetratricopeptide (TPR) repeat protein
MIRKTLLLPLAFLLLAVCATRPAVSPPPAMEETRLQPGPSFNLDEKIGQAESLAARGGYVHLRRAFCLYQAVETLVPDKSRYAEGYAMTALLLAARTKEVGVRNGAYLAKARELVRGEETLAALAPDLETVDLIPVKTAGVWADSQGQEVVPPKETPAPESPGTDPRVSPAAGPFHVYIQALRHEQTGQVEAAKAVLDEALRSFPGSLLLQFKRAILPPADLRLLEEISEKDPEFFESFLGQGQLALAGGALVTAEKHLLRAEEGVPESPLIAILLASVNFGTEEYDRSLAFYERTLEVAPAYKEALLGEAICLSCLGRPTEAIPLLEDLLARGPALRGECLFWLAANLHETGDNERAAAEIEKAKAVLPVARIFTLAGTIALERSHLQAAEKDLKVAVGLDPGESEAFFGLGKLYARRLDWIDSALNFMISGHGFESEEKKILEKIGQVESSGIPEERKGKLLARKRFQLEKILLTKATARFNAAAGYYNAGDLENALIWAQGAAAHPYFAERSKAFIALIASRKQG